MASMSDSNSPGAARRTARMVRSGQTPKPPKPVVKQKLMVDPKPNDSKLLAKLPVTQAHLNTIKKYYGI